MENNIPIIPNYYNKYYILIDQSNNIIDGWSNGPHPEKDISQAICINDQGTYQFRLYPNGEENPSLYDYINNIPLYKYENGEVIAKTKAELKIDKALQLNKQLSNFKKQYIEKTKSDLAQYLSTHPLVWEDQKCYSVTQQKQMLLAQQLILYAVDPSALLYWNASGEESIIWDHRDLLSLSEAINNYVRPFIQYQQQKEIEINEAETYDDLQNIEINYNLVMN